MFRDGMEILYEEEGRGYLGLSYESYLKKWVLHVKFNPSVWGSTAERYHIIKYCIKILEIILPQLKLRGIDEVIGLCRSKKEAKFNMLFGFKETGFLAVTPEGDHVIILTLEV